MHDITKSSCACGLMLQSLYRLAENSFKKCNELNKLEIILVLKCVKDILL